jgi:hypothetical protein
VVDEGYTHGGAQQEDDDENSGSSSSNVNERNQTHNGHSHKERYVSLFLRLTVQVTDSLTAIPCGLLPPTDPPMLEATRKPVHPYHHLLYPVKQDNDMLLGM